MSNRVQEIVEAGVNSPVADAILSVAAIACEQIRQTDLPDEIKDRVYSALMGKAGENVEALAGAGR